MKRLIALAIIAVGLTLHAELEVSNVQVFSGMPWREVAVGYTITGTARSPRCLRIRVCDNEAKRTNDCMALTGVSLESGRHVMKWNAQADGVKVFSSNVVATVEIVAPLYCVIDLSGGVGATSYPVTGMMETPPLGWTDEYKTSKLVLRRIDAGTFMMGSPSDELGRWGDEILHQVTLTRSFYIGVFEVTQRQWELVMGTRPSAFYNEICYATRPVENVSYDMIRGNNVGAGWPTNDVADASSFLGRLRAKTGIAFDLPLESQWEYACRAGTTTSLNSGKNLIDSEWDNNLAEVGRYFHNSGADASAAGVSRATGTGMGTAKVGSYLPNAWGLYDMHGNVREWCLDWYGEIASSAVKDPVGSAVGTERLLRGGSWHSGHADCRSASRDHKNPSSTKDWWEDGWNGFRIVCAQ